ncbi:MAG: hypothetical protein FJ148_11745 [Deltaproteobacteria bacterium]|nr:hypothetical protein [Deltaproteobacteria bacterium]
MRTRELAVSCFVAAFVTLKLIEGFGALEAWPLTHVPMFAVRRPPEELPVRRTIEARRAGRWFELRPWQLGLNRAELAGRLLRDPDPGVGCGEVVREFNTRRPAWLRIEEAYVRALTVARPGSGARDVEHRFPCPLDVTRR